MANYFDGSQSIMTQKRMVRQDEVQKLHAKTFGAWANAHLRKQNIRLNNLQKDFSTGHNLISLVEILSGEVCAQKYPRSKQISLRVQKIENVSFAINFINKFVKVNVNAADIVDGNLKVILSILWRLILHFSLLQTTSGNNNNGMKQDNTKPINTKRKEASDLLLKWVKDRTNGYNYVNIKDYENSFNDGMAFCALVHKFDNSIIDFNQLTPSRPYDNLALAFRLAAEKMNIPPLIDPADMVNPDPSKRPDEQCLITYISQWPAAFALKSGLSQFSTNSNPNNSFSNTPPPSQNSSFSSSSSSSSNQFPPLNNNNNNNNNSSNSLVWDNSNIDPNLINNNSNSSLPIIQPDFNNTSMNSSPSSSSSNVGSSSNLLTTTTTTTTTTKEKGKVAILKITAIEARGLPVTGIFKTKPDAYCVLTCYRQKEKTRKIRSEVNPKWNTEFKFYVEDPECLVLIEIFDWDRMTADDFLGQVEIPFKQIKVGLTEETWFTLQPKKIGGKVSGEIALSFNLEY